MRDPADRIHCIGEHRGVGLHDCQSEERLAVVRRELDVVLDLNDIRLLTEICGDFTWSPEARLYRRCEAQGRARTRGRGQGGATCY